MQFPLRMPANTTTKDLNSFVWKNNLVHPISLKMAKTEAEFEKALEDVKALRERLHSGEDFAELVRLESDDKGNDGNLGTLVKGRMVPEFEKRPHALKPG